MYVCKRRPGKVLALLTHPKGKQNPVFLDICSTYQETILSLVTSVGSRCCFSHLHSFVQSSHSYFLFPPENGNEFLYCKEYYRTYYSNLRDCYL